MKTWEMIKELTENPEKKFKRKTDGLEIRNICGRFNWEPGYTFLGVNDEWEEVKEPVDFMEAVKSGKRITLKTNVYVGDKKRGNLLGIYNRTIKELLTFISEYNEPTIREIITNGEFYIED